MYFERWRYALEDDAVKVKRTDLFDSESYEIRYEEVSNDPTEVEYSSKARVIFAVVVWCWCGFGITVQVFNERNWKWILLWAAAILLAYGIWVVSKRHYLVFQGTNRNLIIPVPKKDDSGMRRFVESFREQRKSRILATFSQPGVPPGSLADEIQKLAWLRNSGVLTDSEFDTLKKNLVSVYTRGDLDGPGSVQ